MKRKRLITSIMVFLTAIIMSTQLCLGADVTLRWDANTESDLAGYQIYSDTNSGPPYSNIIDVGNVTQYTVDNLDPNNDYFFAVTAYDESGLESDYSNEVNTIHPSPPEKVKFIGGTNLKIK